MTWAALIISLLFCGCGGNNGTIEEWHYLAWNGIIQRETDSLEIAATNVRFASLGRVINLPLEEVSIESPQSHPLRCCAAVYRAIVRRDPEAYVMLAAPRIARTPDGSLKEEYNPDLAGALGYERVTKHFPMEEPIVIRRHYRWGGRHVFDVAVAFEEGESRISVAFIEEYVPGRYRYVTDYGGPEAFLYPSIRLPLKRESEMEYETIASAREPEKLEEYLRSRGNLVFSFKGLWGDSEEGYPVYAAMRGGCLSQYREIEGVLSKMTKDIRLRDGEQSAEDAKLANTYVTEYSREDYMERTFPTGNTAYALIERLRHRLPRGRATNSRKENVGYVVETLPDYSIYLADNVSGRLSFFRLVLRDGKYRAGLYVSEHGFFSKFLRDSLLSKQLVPIMERELQACYGASPNL